MSCFTKLYKTEVGAVQIGLPYFKNNIMIGEPKMDIGGPKMFKESKPPKRKKKKCLFNRIADSLSFNELCKGQRFRGKIKHNSFIFRELT